MKNWNGTTAVALALVLFVGSRAVIAFAFEPRVSDTILYAIYAFVTGDAHRLGQSPYDRFEKLVVSADAPGDPSPPRFEEVTIEYPPLAVALMTTPLPFISSAATAARARGDDAGAIAAWKRSFRSLYFVADVASAMALGWWLRRRGLVRPWGLVVSALGGILLAYLLYDRLDLALGFALLGALGALVAGRRYIALALLALAVNLKVVPVLLLPLFVFGGLPASGRDGGIATRQGRRELSLAFVAFAAALVAIVLPFRLRWGPRVWDFLAYHGQRGLQVESTWSSILLVAAHFGYPLRVVNGFGTYGVTGPQTGALATASAAAVLMAVTLTYALLWRACRRWRGETVVAEENTATTLAARHPQFFVWASFAVLAVAMAGAKVFSPQYLCWFLPTFLLVEPPSKWGGGLAVLLFLSACTLTTLVYPLLWGEVVRPVLAEQGLFALPTVRVSLLLLGRNLLWTGFGVVALLNARQTSGSV